MLITFDDIYNRIHLHKIFRDDEKIWVYNCIARS